jgi:chemotaxis protein methyltransferase CheR
LDTLAPLVPVVTRSGVCYRKDNIFRRVAIPAVEVRQDACIADVPPLEPRPSSHVPSTLAAGIHDYASLHPTTAHSHVDPVADIRQALAAGDYERVFTLTQADDPASAVMHIRALANIRGSENAAQYAQRVITRHSFSTELHLLHALLLLDVKRHAEAEQALRRALYLDRSVAIAHFLLGSTLRDQGKVDGARRAYRNARDLARARPPDEELPFADGERAAGLAAIADAELALLETKEKAS